ncbi:MAG: hypothetical protein IPM92_03355 [Saprospiraceae bacterium]|nr:hypothetical protein [Saprospiraceae bacterium]
MKRKYFLSVFIISFCFAGCHQKNGSNENTDQIIELAELFCRAEALKNERFVLADQIRFLEDSTLIDTSNVELKSQMENLRTSANQIILKTKLLADSVLALQNHIYHGLEPEAKKRLDQEFLLQINKLCFLKKNSFQPDSLH